MSADIIQFIPRPKHGRERTDFPTIAFRSAVPNDPAKANVNQDRVAKGSVSKPRLAKPDPDLDQAVTAPSEYVPSDWSEK